MHYDTVEVGFYEPGFYELSLFMNFFSIPFGCLFMLITQLYPRLFIKPKIASCQIQGQGRLTEGLR